MAVPTEALLNLWEASQRFKESPTVENERAFKAALEIVLMYERREKRATDIFQRRQAIKPFYTGLGVFALLALLCIVIVGLFLTKTSLFLSSSSTPTVAPISEATLTLTPHSILYENDFQEEGVDEWFGYGSFGINILDDGNRVLGIEANNVVSLTPSTDWVNYAIQLDFFVPDWHSFGDGGFSILVRNSPLTCQYYSLWLTASKGFLSRHDGNSETCSEGETVDLRSFEVDIAAGQWHTVYIEAEGQYIRWNINNSVMYEVNDLTYPVGGLEFATNGSVYIDNVIAWSKD